jgi:hypothetical protein
MSIGYENIFRFPPYTSTQRTGTGDWPDAPWLEYLARRTPWRDRFDRRAGVWTQALRRRRSEVRVKECGNER